MSSTTPAWVGTLIVADDDPDIRLLVSVIADHAGWYVDAVGDGAAALDVLGDELPDAFVFDVNMPGMSGTDACRAIKQSPATGSIPVLLMSAETSPCHLTAAHAAGCDRFLSKPFTRQQLLQALDDITQHGH